MHDRNDDEEVICVNTKSITYTYYHEMIQIITIIALINVPANTEMMETDGYSFMFLN